MTCPSSERTDKEHCYHGSICCWCGKNRDHGPYVPFVPWLSPGNGWTCSACGTWVHNGITHVCYGRYPLFNVSGSGT